MRRDRDGDQQIAGLAGRACEALALEPHLLALIDPGGNLDLDLLAGRQLHPLLGTLGGFRERDRKRGGQVTARGRDVVLIKTEIAGAAPGAAAAAEHVFQNVLEAGKAPAAGIASGPAQTLRPEREGLERTLGTETAGRAGTAPLAKTLEALETRLAFGIDLAAVEGLALVGIAQDFMGGIDLGKARGGLGIMLVGVRMQLLGKPPEGSLDLRGARALGYPKHLIGVAHSRDLPSLPIV